MFTKDFSRILSNWQGLLKETTELFEEGQKKFLHASKSYFDSMKYFSEISGNTPLGEIYDTLSKNIDSLDGEDKKGSKK